jgi:hypothetical protein
MQCGIERTVLHLQEVVRGPLNMLSDLMAVSGAIQKRPQDEHVKRALEKTCSLLCLFIHRRQSTSNLKVMVDIRLSIVKGSEDGILRSCLMVVT